MPAITRRSFVFLTGAAAATNPVSAGTAASPKLHTLIAAHEAAYAEFHRVVHRVGSSKHCRDQADKVEQKALLAVCSYSVLSRDDRRTKANYLLAVEARGELDLQEHMQAILHSMM